MPIVQWAQAALTVLALVTSVGHWTATPGYPLIHHTLPTIETLHQDAGVWDFQLAAVTCVVGHALAHKFP